MTTWKRDDSVFEEFRLRRICMRYLLQRPQNWDGKSILIAVHGISRNWRAHAEAFAPLCEQRRTALIVPRFSRSGYRGYQRLETGSRGLGPDEALLEVVEHATQKLDQTTEQGFDLFGFSGGAQFAHRFTLRHPHVVRTQVLAAAGFYTMPNARRRFPYGLALQDGSLDPRGFHVPTLVSVGSLDTERDEDLRVSASLDREQGRNRLERARRYVFAVRALAAASGHTPNCRLRTMEEATHDFGHCVQQGQLVKSALDFVAAAERSATGHRTREAASLAAGVRP